MREIVKTVYKFEELNEKAQEKAIRDFSCGYREYDWLDDIEHSFNTMLNYITTLSFNTGMHDIDWNRYKFDIDTDIMIYEYYNENTGDWDSNKDVYLDDITGVRAYTWLVNNLTLVDKLYTISPLSFKYHKEETQFKYSGKNRTKMCFKLGELKDKIRKQDNTYGVDVQAPIVCKNNKLDYILAMPTGYCDDYIPLECFKEFQEQIKAGKDLSVADYFQMIAARYSDSYNREIEYQDTDEYIIEFFNNNDYEFYENGEVY